MYVIILGKLLVREEFLKNVVQLQWFGTSTSSLSSLFIELGMNHITDQGGSWINSMLKDLCVFNIELVRSLFFWTFWEKMLRFLIIILESHLQLSELT